MKTSFALSGAEKRKVLLFAFIMLALLAVIRQAWVDWQSFLFFFAGYLLGFFLLFLDENFIYSKYNEKIDSSIISSDDANEKVPQTQLMTRSIFFLLALPFLAVFTFTSTGSPFAEAFVWALLTSEVAEIWALRKEPLVFSQRFFAESKHWSTQQEIQRIAWLSLGILVVLLLLWLL
jgi:hypothetical protein